jgi:hypothetical protein
MPSSGILQHEADDPRADRRFGPIDEAVGNHRTRVLSVDVFDTLLWRQVPKPTDVHLVVGSRLADAGALAAHIDPRAYARLRILAEAEARRIRQLELGSTEVSLADIHAVLAPSGASTLGVEEAVACELAVEQAVTFVDRRLAAYLHTVSANRPDLTLVAVSDTYFTPAQLRGLLSHALAHAGLHDLSFATVYTSADRGTGKGAELWKLVVDDLGVGPDQVVHIGDNVDADVVSPGRLGIRGLHYPMHTERYAPIDGREGIIGPPGDATHWCDDRAGDGGLTAIRRRATFLPAPRPVTDREEVAWETGTAVLGPVFTGFAQWVLERADAAGSERVVCLMREGKFLKTLIDAEARARRSRTHIDTAWVSREAVARASIYQGSEEELRSFLERLRAPSPDQLLDSFGLDADDVPELGELVARYVATNRVAEASEALIDLVLGRPALVAKVVERSRQHRRRLLDHFETAAGPGRGPVMVVDVGWSGTIQETMQGMLRSDGSDTELAGLYLLAHVGSSRRVLRGAVIEGFLGGVGTIPFDVAGITGGPELIELVCTSEDGSLLEITTDGRPLLEPLSASPEESAARELVQTGIRAYQAERLSYLDGPEPGRRPFETTPAGRAILGRVLKRFLSQPNLDEADAFSWWQHEENFGSRQVDELVPARFRPTLSYRTPETLHWAPMSELYWVGGAAALVDNETADSILLMREGTAHPGLFGVPSGAGDVRLTLIRSSAGPGFDDGTSLSLPVGVNRRGLSLVEWIGPAAGLERVVVRPAERDALLRLDLFELVATGPEGDDTTVFRWQYGDEPTRLPATGVWWVAPGMVAVDAGSVVTFDLADPASTGELRLTLAGAYLPTPPGSTLATAGTDAQLAETRKELDEVYQTRLFRTSAFPRRVYGAIRRRLL